MLRVAIPPEDNTPKKTLLFGGRLQQGGRIVQAVAGPGGVDLLPDLAWRGPAALLSAHAKTVPGKDCTWG